jgi:hypothetical protein
MPGEGGGCKLDPYVILVYRILSWRCWKFKIYSRQNISSADLQQAIAGERL